MIWVSRSAAVRLPGSIGVLTLRAITTDLLQPHDLKEDVVLGGRMGILILGPSFMVARCGFSRLGLRGGRRRIHASRSITFLLLVLGILDPDEADVSAWMLWITRLACARVIRRGS